MRNWTSALLAMLVAGCDCGGAIEPLPDTARVDGGHDAGPPDAALDCGAMRAPLDERIACGAELCDVPSEACCGRADSRCGAAYSCVDRGAVPTECTMVTECLGHAGQCAAGSWCCPLGGGGTRCVADEGSCTQILCSPGDPSSCPLERPLCRMLSLEGGYECTEGDAGAPDAG